MQDAEFVKGIRMLPALAFAAPIDLPELSNNLFFQLPVDAYDLALYYFEVTYIDNSLDRHHYFPSKYGTTT